MKQLEKSAWLLRFAAQLRRRQPSLEATRAAEIAVSAFGVSSLLPPEKAAMCTSWSQSSRTRRAAAQTGDYPQAWWCRLVPD